MDSPFFLKTFYITRELFLQRMNEVTLLLDCISSVIVTQYVYNWLNRLVLTYSCRRKRDLRRHCRNTWDVREHGFGCWLSHNLVSELCVYGPLNHNLFAILMFSSELHESGVKLVVYQLIQLLSTVVKYTTVPRSSTLKRVGLYLLIY